MRANGSPKPKFETDEDRTTFLIRLPVHRAALAIPVTDPLAGEVTGQVEAWIQATLKACETPRTSAEIQKFVGIRHRETFLQNYLNPLRKKAWLKRTVPGRPTSRLQRYRTTHQGVKWLVAAAA